MNAVIEKSKSLGNSSSWNGGWVPKTRAHERYLLLIAQMRAEHASANGGSEWGWQTAVAKRLKITQSYLSKLAAAEGDERSLGLEPLEHAIRKVGISPLFFFSAFPTQPRYRDFVGPRKLPPPMGYAAFAKFIDEAPALGMQLTEAERHALSQMEWPTEPSVASYMHMLSAIRACAPSEDTRARMRSLPTG